MAHRVLVFVMMFFIPCTLYARTQEGKHGQALIDSLVAELPEVKEDTNKAEMLNRIAIAYYAINLDEGMCYGRAFLQLSEKLNWEKGEARAIHYIGLNYGAQGKVDSQLLYCNRALEITRRIKNKKDIPKILNNIGNAYNMNHDYAKALKYYTEAAALYKAEGDKKSGAITDCNIGQIYAMQTDYPSALEHYQEALKTAEASGIKADLALIWFSIGHVYQWQGNYPDALKSYLAALKNYLATGNKMNIAWLYLDMGAVYYYQNNYPEALNYYSTALKIFKEVGDKYGIGQSFECMANIDQDQGNYPEALRNCLAALKIYEALDKKYAAAGIYVNLGQINYKKANYPDALKNYFVALPVYEADQDRDALGYLYGAIGAVYVSQNKVAEGRQWIQKGLALAKEIGAKKYIKEGYGALASTDSTSGDYKSALENYKMYVLFKDSMYNEENTRKLTQEAMQYDFDKKEAVYRYQKQLVDEQVQRQQQELTINQQALRLVKNEQEIEHLARLNTQVLLNAEFNKGQANEKELELLAQKQNVQTTELKLKNTELSLKEKELQAKKAERNLYLLSGILLTAAGVYSFYRFRQRKQLENKQALLNERLRLSRDLHDDIGSTLSSLNFYSEIATGKLKKQKQDEALEVLNKMGSASRIMTERISDLVWSINPENDSLQNAVDRMRSITGTLFQHTDVQYAFETKGDTDHEILTVEQRKNLLLIYKEALNNIIKYAACKTVSIGLYINDDRLTLRIKDDGTGFDMQQTSNRNKTGGNGLKNMKARARQIGGDLTVSSAKGKGTEIMLSFAV